MSLIDILNPFSCCASIKNFGLKKEYALLTPKHKTITLAASVVFTLLTLGLGTFPYLRMLVGRFRKIEQGKVPSIKKIQCAAAGILPQVKATVPPPPQTTKQILPVPDDQQLEKEFWESHFQNENLHRFLEMAAINGDADHQKTALSIMGNYLKHKKTLTAAFTLTQAQQDLLIKLICAQLKANEHAHPAIDKASRMRDGRRLITHQTGSDGSCALHALLGVPVSGVYMTDAAARRKELCEWLENQYNRYQLHERAINILQDYFDHFKNAPETFRNAVRDKYQQFRSAWEKLGSSREDKLKKDDIKADFVYDRDVFRAYCNELRNVSRYMLQEELIMAAECFGCKLELHQPEWNNLAGKGGDKRNIKSDTFNATASGDIVHVWYNGLNHYERAETLK